jgi:uncharacterized metal-binding protein
MSLAKPRSDGDFHGRLTLSALPVAVIPPALAAFVVTGDAAMGLLSGLFGGAGCVLQLFVEPDLDQEIVSASEWRVVNLLPGPLRLISILLGSLWIAIWFPYAVLMPHRHPLSHIPVLSTGIRVLYLCGVIAALNALVQLLTGYYVWFDPTPETKMLLGCAFYGLCVGDVTHWGRDTRGWEV